MTPTDLEALLRLGQILLYTVPSAAVAGLIVAIGELRADRVRK